LNSAYTAFLKRIAIADVTCVAIGFLIRVVAGPKIANVEVSSWLILCTFFGALFLACAKRRGELMVTEGGDGGRSVLQRYSDRLLDILVAIAATATLLCYAIYTVSPETIAKFRTDHLLYTVPFVFLGLGRYLLLLYRRQRGEDPARLLFTDPGLLLAIGGWLAASWAASALTR
jgi:4-hydroxybenzoate polyprenyltransferase